MIKPHDLFFEIFPQGFRALQNSDSVLWKTYLDEMELATVSSWEDLRYFAAFVGQRKGRDSFVAESLLWEWITYSVAKQEIGSQGRIEPGRVFLNPSLSFIRLTQAHPEFAKEAGLYVMIWDEATQRVIDYQLQPLEAQMIDLLEEDRKYTLDQLLDMTLIELPAEFSVSKDQGRQKLEALVRASILLVR
jgi:hypothetical protein